MTKADLINRVVRQTGLPRIHATYVVNSFLDVVKSSLENGNNIEIRGFGTFKIKPRKARNARNPKSGETVPLPDRKVPVFKASKEFKNLVMNSDENKI